MEIKVEFKSFAEMVSFAEDLLKGRQDVTPQKEKPESVKIRERMETAAAVPTVAAAQQPSTGKVPANPGTVPVSGTASAPVKPVTAAVPTAEPAYELDDLARAAMTLMDVGRQGELQNLLAQFQVAALPMLPKSQYGAFATALREMGAQI